MEQLSEDDVAELQEILHQLHGYSVSDSRYHVDNGDGTEAAIAHGRALAYRRILSGLQHRLAEGEFPDHEQRPDLRAVSTAMLELQSAPKKPDGRRGWE